MSDTCNAIYLLQADGTGVQFANTSDIAGTTFVSKPTVNVESYTYSGTPLGPTITGLDSTNTVVTGATATDAGTYTLTIELKDKTTMVWSDLTNADLIYTYTINKATPTLTLSKSSVSLSSSKTSDTVTVTTSPSGAGAVTATSSNTSIATVSVSGNTVTITATQTTGSATVSVYTASNSNCNQSGTSSVSVSCQFVPMKTFAAATDAEIAQMVAAADAGQIDLYSDCGWRVGQERTTTISSIAASGSYGGVSWSVSEVHNSQNVTFVLMHHGGPKLVTPVKDKNGNNRYYSSFVVGLKDCLDSPGYMNSTDFGYTWSGSARSNWCNGGFRQAINSTLRPIFKQFQCITGYYWARVEEGSGSNSTTQDYFALPATKEITGESAGSTTTEANALTQFTWYQTSSNRVKNNRDSTLYYWWTRSPNYWDSRCFVNIRCDDGFAGYVGRAYDDSKGISPFGCI